MILLPKKWTAIALLLWILNSPAIHAQQTPADSIPQAPGIYYKNKRTRQFIELEPSILTNGKSGGAGELAKRVLISGLINAKQRAVVPNEEADVKVRTYSPLFYFVFDTTARNFATVGAALVAQRPKDFMLIRLKRTKGAREMVVGKYNSISSNQGIDAKSRIAFSSSKIRAGVYEVTIDDPLEPGEYCFFFSVESQAQAMGTKVYDFSRPEPAYK